MQTFLTETGILLCSSVLITSCVIDRSQIGWSFTRNDAGRDSGGLCLRAEGLLEVSSTPRLRRDYKWTRLRKRGLVGRCQETKQDMCTVYLGDVESTGPGSLCDKAARYEERSGHHG